MLHIRILIIPWVVAGLAVYGYARTDSIYLLLAAAWFAGLAVWNILEALLLTLGKRSSTIKQYAAAYPLQLPIVGLVVGVFSVAANFVLQSHWFLLAHGIFWIFLGICLGVIVLIGSCLLMGILRDSFQTYFRKELRPAFQAFGVKVQLSSRERLEKDITSIWPGRSFAFIDVTSGPIRWVNFKENRYDENTKYMEYGVPDFKVKPTFPKVRIRSARVRSVPLVGNILDVRWRGKDFGLGLIDRLNGDVSLRQPMSNAFSTGYLIGDLAIDAYPKNGCWILAERTRSELPSRELWDCYETLASHLLGRREPLEVETPLRKWEQRRRAKRRERRRHRRIEPDRPLNYDRLEPAWGRVRGLLAAGKDAEAATIAEEFGMTTEQLLSFLAPPETIWGRAIKLVIRIGATPARNNSVTQQYIVFVDEEGASHLIDLEECHRNYVAWITEEKKRGNVISIPGWSHPALPQGRSVGFRCVIDQPPWMSFAKEPLTMFQFRSKHELKPESTEGRPWGQPLKKPAGAPLNLG